ncbi:MULTISPECIES: YcxB family protein [Pseudoalteromonas]|uniref:YcxB family protein n=1 Tax=Pseudoalteromonas fuliginea TaxID=1872678 RepID=A0ABQ6RFG7_9GAMM|nr:MULTISPECIES: YcxB family protein [Pseudoalteromonas]KAA1152240.1 YcxB family protein [Pseudoalteromonas fuliginea]KAA1166337.1 YcxB family protein [Pseudoalteromonas fuliginea]MDQ2044648.1 YcxB family protein [Pseudoalteromonas sp. 20-92]
MALTTTYTLDRPYFYECFDESLPYSKRAQPKYFLLMLLTALGLFGIYGLNDHYLGSFLIMLAILECVAFYYRRPWWVTRQMLSRASGSEVTLTFDDEGIKSVNHYKNYQLVWQDINEVIDTERGLLLKNKRGMQYISKQILSPEIINYINKKATR